MSTLFEQKTALTPRVVASRQAVREYRDEIDPYSRGRIATEVYRGGEGQPRASLSAEVIARCLEELPTTVVDQALFAGSAIRRMRVHGGISDEQGWRRTALFPEFASPGDDFVAPVEYAEDYDWWRENGASMRGRPNRARRDNSWLYTYGVASPYGQCGGHTLPDHEILLKSGVRGLRETLKHSIVLVCETGSSDPSGEAPTGPGPSKEPLAGNRVGVGALTQFRAMDRILAALETHILRWADAVDARASELEANAAGDDTETSAFGPQAASLRAVAARCRRIAVEPPDTFAEALQLLYFSNYVDRIGNPGDASSFGRVDQIVSPWLDRDLSIGRLTEEEACELVCHFVVKIWGDQESRNITIGGLTPDGQDGTNRLSRMILEAMDQTESVIDLSVRVHSETPDDFLTLVANVMRRNFGRPDVYNDDVTIPALVRAGIDLGDARDYAPLGCVEVMIPGRSPGRTMCMGLNHVKILELVLNEGRCLVTGDQVWDDVPATYESYDALWREFLRRTESVVALGCEIIRQDEMDESAVRPRPWLTVLSRGGLGDGRDMTGGQSKYDLVGVTMDGVADIANALAAVRQMVFQEQRVSLSQLRRILAADWSGDEVLRSEIINTVPRFGQDNSAVDAIASDVATHFADCFADERTAFDGVFLPMIFGVTTSLLNGHGPKTGATPAGRRHGDVLAQSLQPSSTGPQGSPTEVLRSAAAVPGHRFPGGISNVQNFDPTLVQGDWGLSNIKNLIRGFFSLGGIELAMNFVSVEQLHEARSCPDDFPYLMVRLFGMSARFVLLSPELQEEVIRRAEAACRG